MKTEIHLWFCLFIWALWVPFGGRFPFDLGLICPGARRNSQESPREPRSIQEQPGVPRSNQECPGAPNSANRNLSNTTSKNSVSTKVDGQRNHAQHLKQIKNRDSSVVLFIDVGPLVPLWSHSASHWGTSTQERPGVLRSTLERSRAKSAKEHP